MDQISIIMAAYNAENTISCAIESVLSQTYPQFELLIIDDCSEDSTCLIVESYIQKDPRVHLIRQDRNRGVSATRLLGVQAARGEWIAILDSDDAWTANKLEKQMLLQKTTGANLLYTGSAFIDHSGTPLEWILHVPTKITYKELLKQNLLSNSSSLCRKALYEKYYVVGDEMHEDFALWLNILRQGETAYGIDEPLLIYRLSSKSKSGNKIRAAKMNWNTYRHVGLNIFEAVYYECCYIFRSFMKYRHLRSSQNSK